MRYELYLRSGSPPSDLPPRILEDLAENPDVTADARGQWKHQNDDGVVGVALHPPGDARWEGDAAAADGPLGVDLFVAGGAGEGLALQLATLALDWAARWTLDLYDPQLGRSVGKDDLEAICARVKRHSEYLTDTVGLGEQSTRFMDVDVAAPKLGLRTRFYFGLAAALFVLGLAAHYCS